MITVVLYMKRNAAANQRPSLNDPDGYFGKQIRRVAEGRSEGVAKEQRRAIF